MKTKGVLAIALAASVAGSNSAFGLGHGPAFGLATPTLGDGQWSSDTAAMSMTTSEGTSYMFREMIGYGINEDLQLNLSFPLSRTVEPASQPPRTRFGTMMNAFGENEASLMWRFHRVATGVGNRVESALIAGAAAPLQERRGGVRVGPAGNIAAVTGFASRSWYGWLGGGFQGYLKDGDDRLGDLPYVSAVVGYRPPIFRADYPKPDWRLFAEVVAEFPGRDRVNGIKDPNSGGTLVWLGPSTLGLYGAWGVEAGILFPISQDLNGTQPEGRSRAVLNFTYWF